MRRGHHLPLVVAALVLGFLLLLSQIDFVITRQQAVIAVLVHFVANVSYLWFKHRQDFTVQRTLEYGLLSAVLLLILLAL